MFPLKQLSTLHLLNSAFDEGVLILLLHILIYSCIHIVARSYSRYTPGKNYHWEFPKGKIIIMYTKIKSFLAEKEKVKKEKDYEELNELQYKRVDIILSELVKQFPVRAVTDKVVYDSVMECISLYCLGWGQTS